MFYILYIMFIIQSFSFITKFPAKTFLYRLKSTATNIKSPEAEYILRFDGGSRGNPGLAGSGCVLYERAGRYAPLVEIWHGYYFLGPQGITNNVAEYAGLIYGLKHCVALGLPSLCIEGDSQLVVRQILGQYEVHSESMKILHAMAKGLLIAGNTTASNKWSISFIRREENGRADALSNVAMSSMTCHADPLPWPIHQTHLQQVQRLLVDLTSSPDQASSVPISNSKQQQPITRQGYYRNNRWIPAVSSSQGNLQGSSSHGNSVGSISGVASMEVIQQLANGLLLSPLPVSEVIVAPSASPVPSAATAAASASPPSLVLLQKQPMEQQPLSSSTLPSLADNSNSHSPATAIVATTEEEEEPVIAADAVAETTAEAVTIASNNSTTTLTAVQPTPPPTKRTRKTKASLETADSNSSSTVINSSGQLDSSSSLPDHHDGSKITDSLAVSLAANNTEAATEADQLIAVTTANLASIAADTEATAAEVTAAEATAAEATAAEVTAAEATAAEVAVTVTTKKRSQKKRSSSTTAETEVAAIDSDDPASAGTVAATAAASKPSNRKRSSSSSSSSALTSPTMTTSKRSYLTINRGDREEGSEGEEEEELIQLQQHSLHIIPLFYWQQQQQQQQGTSAATTAASADTTADQPSSSPSTKQRKKRNSKAVTVSSQAAQQGASIGLVERGNQVEFLSIHLEGEQLLALVQRHLMKSKQDKEGQQAATAVAQQLPFAYYQLDDLRAASEQYIADFLSASFKQPKPQPKEQPSSMSMVQASNSLSQRILRSSEHLLVPAFDVPAELAARRRSEGQEGGQEEVETEQKRLLPFTSRSTYLLALYDSDFDNLMAVMQKLNRRLERKAATANAAVPSPIEELTVAGGSRSKATATANANTQPPNSLFALPTSISRLLLADVSQLMPSLQQVANRGYTVDPALYGWALGQQFYYSREQARINHNSSKTTV